MPKRVIDGDALWKSDKLRNVQPTAYRAEYANLVPLALANGVFECDPYLVWVTVYAYNRPEYTPETVNSLLAEFERVGMLFRWQGERGKQWGYWVAIDKTGRLPTESRLLGRHEKVGPQVPLDELHKFVATIGQPMVDHVTTNGEPQVSLGFGFGSGLGFGTDSVNRIRSPLPPKRKKRPLTQIPEDFAITEKHLAWARKHSIENLEPYLERFKLHYQANGKPMHNWDATFYSWILSPYQTSGGKGNGQQATRRSLTDQEFADAMEQADRELANRNQSRH